MKLTFHPQDMEPMVYHLDKPSFTVGRSPSCDVPLKLEGLSRQHCRVDFRKGDVFITDLGSTNGVFIDGKRIPPKVPIRYQLFLPLSIGPIPVVTIEPSDGSSSIGSRWITPATEAPEIENIALDLTRTKKITTRRPPPSRKVAPPVIDERSSWVTNIVAVLVMAAGFYWLIDEFKLLD